MYIHRELEKTIKPFLKRREILAIIGARQVGKTTFLEYLFSELKKIKKIEFLTFEKERDLALFDNIEDFKEYYKNYEILFIDEFHYAKDGGKKLKYLFDTTKTKLIISGSSSLELTFETGRYLVGRMFKFLLYPFSFREFLSFKDENLSNLLNSDFKEDIFSQKIDSKRFFGQEINLRLQKYFEEYVVFGGYPAVALAKTKEEKVKILESILENYLLRDIGVLLNLGTKSELIKIAEFLSAQVGNLLNYQELSNASNLKYKETLKHLEILKNTFIIDLLKPFYKNPRTELVKVPKVYFLDNGFRNYLVSDFKEIKKRNDTGQLVENFTFSVLKRKNFERINFWRTKSKAEIDFILQKNREIIPVEVKYSLSPSLGKSFYSFIEKFSPEQGYVFTQGFSDIKKIKKTRIYFLPVYYL